MKEPKEQAFQIYLLFLRKLPFDKEVITENKHGKWTYNSEELAREHALICVDEILNELEDIEDGYRMDRVEFWESVKQEIKKL